MGRSGPRPGGTLATLRSVRHHATMGLCDFNGVSGELITLQDGRQMTPTEFIRDRTRLWRQTWILPGLDRLIAKEEAKRQPKEQR